MKAKYDFSGKSALVIGGTTGIGRAAALAFADAGANLFVAGLGAAEGQDLKDEINRRFSAVAVEFAEVDVRSEDAVRMLHEAAYNRFGRIDTAFNNAGVPGKTAPIHELSQADYDLIMDVNLRGIFFGMKHQIPHMLQQGGGTIVNTSSLFGVMGYATTATYCASKWGVIGLTNSAALEVAKKNIRINAIAPGSTMTPLLTRMFGGEQEAKDTVLPSLPMGRIADPSEIARLVLFLASDESSFITGQAIVIDGGGFVAGADKI
ncbi:MAG TPA: glucose 1-dehydrogenase [Kaistia sp.]|nr:glucose 1-dehydrogenase [Kaistia sp.]